MDEELTLYDEEMAEYYRSDTACNSRTAIDAYRRGQLQTIIKICQIRFNAFDEASELALCYIDDPDRINRIIHAILKVNSWHDLLATP